MLEVRDLRRQGLQPMDLRLEGRCCTSLEGPSGAGKTLLLRALADLDPAEGEIRLGARLREDHSGPEWRRRVAYIPAEPGWWAYRAPEHFVDWSAGSGDREALGLGPEVAARPIADLSTGERLRLALLRALEADPKVLLLDEPTAALDRASTRAVEAMVARRRRAGVAVLWVTHDRSQARRVAGSHLAMAAGRLSAAPR